MAGLEEIRSTKRTIADMIIKGADQNEIDMFLASKKMTVDDLEESKHTLMRAGVQTLGGMAGGALAAPAIAAGVGAAAVPIGIGLGSSMAGQAYDRYREMTGQAVPETPQQAAISAGEDFALDVISPIALSKGIYAGKKILSSIAEPARGMFKAAPLEQYTKVGVQPTAAQVTQSKGLGIVENVLSDYPFSSGPLQKRAQQNLEQLKVANEFLAKEYGDILEKGEFGLLLKGGSEKALERLSGTFDKLYSRVSSEIGADPQKLTNTVNTLKTLVAESKAGPSSGVVNLAQEIVTKAKENGGGLSWDALKKYRTKIGDMLRDPQLVSTRNMQSGDLKRLYAGMTADMEEAAANAGPKVHARWRAVNKYYDTKMARDVPILENIINKGYADDVWNVVMQSSNQGGQRLQTLRRNMKQEEWDAVAGTVLGRLGIANPSQQLHSGDLFSPGTFLTNWNKLSEPAKRALFSGGKYEPLFNELKEFVHVVGDIKNVEQLANKSKTGSVLMFYSLMNTMGGAAGFAAGGTEGAAKGVAATTAMMVAPYSLSKLMTSEKFVRWMADGVKIAKANPQAMSTHLSRLMVLRFEDEIQEEVNGVIRQIIGE